MKKIILYLIMGTSILGAQLMDGEYFVQGNKYYYGWTHTASITVVDKKIVKVTINKINKKGELATENKEYNEKMLVKSGITAKEYSVKLSKNFIKSLKKSDDFHMPEIDIIAGATDSSINFRKMTKFLVKKAESGKTGYYKMKL